MEYLKIINFLDNTLNQPSKFKTKNQVEINDESRGTYNKDNQIEFKNSMLRSRLYDYCDAYILIKGTMTVTPEISAARNDANRKATFTNCVPFTNCISRINNTQVGDAHDIDVVDINANDINYINTNV